MGSFFYLSGMRGFEWRLSPPAWMIMWQVAMLPSPRHQLRQASGAFRSPRASLVHWLHPIILTPILPRMGPALCSRMTSCVVRRQLKNNLSSSDIFHSGRHRLCQERRFKEPDIQDLTSLITIESHRQDPSVSEVNTDGVLFRTDISLFLKISWSVLCLVGSPVLPSCLHQSVVSFPVSSPTAQMLQCPPPGSNSPLVPLLVCQMGPPWI